uniref:Uncharacterized protein n=1 Tax=Rhizophora mucronata TaxID=61149 RepID=A0A2P2J4A6_RHIMU
MFCFEICKMQSWDLWMIIVK